MKTGALIVLISYLLFTGCNSSPFPGYSSLGGDLYINLVELGDKVEMIRPGEYITTDISYRTLDDSLFFSGRRKFLLDPAITATSFNTGILQLSEGDSAGFILGTQNFFHSILNRDLPSFIRDDKFMKIDMRILDVQSQDEYEREKELFLSWAREFTFSEMDIIAAYLEENKLNIYPEPNGIYFLSHEPGNGPAVERGKHVWIHYEGKFLNGKFLDSSRQRDAPLDFVYGNELYLIEGLNYAVGKMREGGKAMILIPSDMGFGPGGSVGGIIPPYTSMIYVVEILKVENRT